MSKPGVCYQGVVPNVEKGQNFVGKHATKRDKSCKKYSKFVIGRLLKTSGLSTLEYGRDTADMMQVYKILHGIP